MEFGQIFTYIMLAFALVGALDRCFGNKFGPGQAFEDGFGTMGPLVLAMVGINTVAPLLSKYLAPVLSPLCQSVGIDPSIVAGMLLANDSGGWPLAMALTQDEEIGRLSGSLIGSVMGTAVLFTIPVGFSATPAEKRRSVALGLIIGLITLPIGCVAGGLFMGIGPIKLLRNLLPLIVLSLIFVIGLKFFESVTVTIIVWFGKLVTAGITVALAIAIVMKQLNHPIADLVPFDESLLVVGSIAIVLSGAFVMLFFVRLLFKKPLSVLGTRLSMNEASVVGMLTTMVNSIGTFGMMKDMNRRGVVVNTAFAVSGAFMLGDHVAFTASTEPSLVPVLIVGKLAGGAAAVAIALLLTKNSTETE